MFSHQGLKHVQIDEFFTKMRFKISNLYGLFWLVLIYPQAILWLIATTKIVWHHTTMQQHSEKEVIKQKIMQHENDA